MGNKCFRVKARGLNGDCSPSGYFEEIIRNVDSVVFERKNVPSGRIFAGCPYDYVVIDGASRYPNFEGGSAAGYGEIIEIDCETEEEKKPDKYDCLNAACVLSTQFETPGIYSYLEDCETACGTGCSGKCLSNKDWQKIQDLSGKLKNKNCKQ